tara:strand:+ start:14964 stop:15731 length:768 start_codon:yes stop_codon:yes gene_type:complete
MAITTILNMNDLLGISPQAQLNLNRVLDWVEEVNSTVGANTAELRVVASTAACKAIAAADRANLDVVFLADSGQALYFSAASVAAEALGPPITVIQPTAGTGRWLALALPPALSVAAAQLTAGAVTVPKLSPLATPPVSGGALAGAPSFIMALQISNTAGNNDFTAAGYAFAIGKSWFVPDATVGALSTIQIQTAAGAANVTEALDIAAATVGLQKDFTTVSPADSSFAANAGLRVATTGTNVGGMLYLTAAIVV